MAKKNIRTRHKINVKNPFIRKQKKVSFSNMDDKRTLITHADDIDTWRKPNNDLVSIFNTTRAISNKEFATDTEQAKKDVRVVDIEDDDVLMNMAKHQTIEFSHSGTVRAGYKEVLEKDKYDKVAILNFADAIVPGGLVLYGAPTQEENICRCSNLYETLLECPLYYNMNRLLGNRTYLDIMIYSPNVLVFRDDESYERVNPVNMDVITCPAPSQFLREDVADEVFTKRIKKILIAAQKRGVNKIVLGAWGCGAFGQDPTIVGRAFAKVLSEVNAFDKVIFAIKSSEGLDESSNYKFFKEAFEKEYVK